MSPFVDLDLLLERYAAENDDLGAIEIRVWRNSFMTYLKPLDQVDSDILPRLSSEVSDWYVGI